MKKIILLLIANISAALLTAATDCYQDVKKDLEAKQYWDAQAILKAENAPSIEDYELGGDWFIPLGEYKDIKIFDEDCIAVQNESEKYGILNKKKELIADYQYWNVLGFSEDIIRVYGFDEEHKFIDCKGMPVSEDSFSDTNDFSESLAAVEKNDKWGFIDRNGSLVIDYQFDSVRDGFHEGFAAVEKNGIWYFIDKEGAFVFQEYFEDAKSFHEGCAGVKKDGKWGFIDKSGSFIIEAKYDDVGNFSEGMAAVQKPDDEIKYGGGEWAYINKSEEIMIDYTLYDYTGSHMTIVSEFRNGYAIVTDPLPHLIDTKGNPILNDVPYEPCSKPISTNYPSTNGVILACIYTDDSAKFTSARYGLTDIDGNCRLPFISERMNDVAGNLVSVVCYEDGEEKCGVLALY